MSKGDHAVAVDLQLLFAAILAYCSRSTSENVILLSTTVSIHITRLMTWNMFFFYAYPMPLTS